MANDDLNSGLGLGDGASMSEEALGSVADGSSAFDKTPTWQPTPDRREALIDEAAGRLASKSAADRNQAYLDEARSLHDESQQAFRDAQANGDDAGMERALRHIGIAAGRMADEEFRVESDRLGIKRSMSDDQGRRLDAAIVEQKKIVDYLDDLVTKGSEDPSFIPYGQSLDDWKRNLQSERKALNQLVVGREAGRQRAPVEDPTFLGETARGFTTGMLGTGAEMLGGALKQVGSTSDSPVLSDAGEAVRSFGKGIRQDTAAQSSPEVLKLGEKGEFLTELKNYVGAKLGEGLGTSVPIIAAAIAGGPVAGVTAGMTLGIGQMRNSLEEAFAAEGIDFPEGKAAFYVYTYGTAIGALESAMEVMGVSQVTSAFKKQVVSGIAQTIAKGAAKGAALEGITETLQELVEIIGVSHATGKPIDWAEAARRMTEAGAAGAIPGTAFGGVTSVAERKGALDAALKKADQLGIPAAEAPVSDKGQPAETVRDVSPSIDPDAAPGRGPSVRMAQADPVLDEARSIIDQVAPPADVAEGGKLGQGLADIAKQPGAASDLVARVAGALSEGQIPTFQQVLQALPKDQNGDPDVSALMERVTEFGAKAWGGLTDEQKTEVYQRFAPVIERAAPIADRVVDAIRSGEAGEVVRDFAQKISDQNASRAAAFKPATEPAVPIAKSVTPDHIVNLDDGQKYKSMKRVLASRGETPEQYRQRWGLPDDYPMVASGYVGERANIARATTSPGEASANLRSAFDSVLASKTKRSDWAKAIGADQAQVDAFVAEALTDGRLKKTKSGAIVRTPKAKATGQRTGQEAAPKAETSGVAASQTTGQVASVPTMDRALEVRLERIESPRARKHAQSLIDAATADDFATALDRLRKDKKAIKPVLEEVARAYTGSVGKTKAGSLGLIANRGPRVAAQSTAQAAVDAFLAKKGRSEPLFAIGESTTPKLTLSPEAAAAARARIAAFTSGQRPKAPQNAVHEPFEVTQDLSDWLGMKAGAKITAHLEHIANKRAAKDNIDGGAHPDLSSIEKVRAFIEDTLVNGSYAMKYEQGEQWNVLRQMPNGEVRTVGLRLDQNRDGAYEVKTAFVARRDVIPGRLEKAFRYNGGINALKWKRDPAAFGRMLADVRQLAQRVRDPSINKISAELTKIQGEIRAQSRKEEDRSGPLAAIGAAPSPLTEFRAREAAKAALKLGRAVVLDKSTRDDMRAAMQQMPAIASERTMTGFVSKVTPMKGARGPFSVDVEIADGSVVAIDNLALDDVIGGRAFFMGVGGGRSVIVHIRYASPGQDGVAALTGERWHETIHALFAEGLFDDASWRLLVDHAESLGVLQTKWKSYLELIRDPRSQTADPDETIAELYYRAYSHRMAPAQLQDALEQESVAIMTELLVMGVDLHLPESIRRILSMIETGEMARGEGKAGAPRVVSPDAVLNAPIAGFPVLSAIAMTVGGEASPNPLFAIRAYHGSPHDFDKFDMSKIGTGEGAQAFGHGLYFAENKATAEAYKRSNVDRNIETPMDEAVSYLAQAEGDRRVALASARRALGNAQHSAHLAETVAILESDKTLPYSPSRLYEVRINASPEDFLDWDKPLSQQSEKVRGAIDPFVEQEWRRQLAQNEATRQALRRKGSSHGADMMIDPSRSDINMATILQSPETRVAASNKLRDQGIPGIRYLDQGSRSAGEGSHNYVVFDDALIEITHKDGTPVSKEEKAAVVAALTPRPDEGPLFSLQTSQSKSLARHFGATRIEDIGPNDQHPGRVLAFHGTEAPDFDRFDLSEMRGFGVHFGSADLADLYASPSKRVTTARVIPATLDLRNVVTLPDMDRWDAPSIAMAVEQGFPFATGLGDEIAGVRGEQGIDVATERLRQRLTDIGIQGIRYWNAGVLPGWAYIVWEPGHVISATSGEPLFALGGGVPDLPAAIDADTGQSMRRDLDDLGYYSKALEAARGLKQAKGTPEQMLAQLKKAGVKDAEIEATGLDKLFADKASVAQASTTPSRKPVSTQDTLFALGGMAAQTADLEALAQAESMQAAGRPREAIWKETGWFQGVDGGWRFEIDDSGAVIGRSDGKLDKVLNHPDLYNAYPDLKRIRANELDGIATIFADGGYRDSTLFERMRGIAGRIIYTTNKDRSPHVLLHEAQHAIQRQEGFSRGGSTHHETPLTPEQRKMLIDTRERRILETAELWNPARFEDFAKWPKREQERYATRYNEIKDGAREEAERDIKVTAYGHTAGEVEARAVEKRMRLTPAQRRARPPWLDYDVPEDQQIVVRIGDGPQESAPGSRQPTPPDIATQPAPDDGLAAPALNAVIQKLKDSLNVIPTQTLLGVRIRAEDGSEVRLNPRRNVRGQTQSATAAVGVRKSRQVDVIAHEMAHALEVTLGAEILDLQQQHRVELEAMSPGATLSEAFADWFSYYITSGPSTVAPALTQAFEDVIEANAPEMLEGIHEAQAMYQDWLKRSSPEALASDVVSTYAGNSWTDIATNDKSLSETIAGKMAGAYTAVIDDLSPVQKMVRRLLETADRNGVTDDAGRPISLGVHENTYKIARMFRGSYATGYSWLKNGIANRGETTVSFPGLSRALETLFGTADQKAWDPAMYQAAGNYLIAKRAVAEYDRLDQKEARLADIDDLMERGGQARQQTAAERDRVRGILERRQDALTRAEALMRDRRNALRSAESTVSRLQERIQAKKDDVLAAQMARDAGLTARRQRDLAALERDSQVAVQSAAAVLDQYETLTTEIALLNAEIEQRRAQVEQSEARVQAIGTAVDGLARERKATAERGASRPPTKENRDHWLDVIAKTEADPKYARIQEFAEQVYQFSHGLLTLRKQAGFLSDDQYVDLAKRRGWYVPFQRDMSDASPETVFGGGTKKWSPFKKFDGSDRAIINPLETLASDAYATAQQIAFNDATGAMAALAERAGPGAASIAHVLSREESAEANAATFDRIRDIALSMGIDSADADRIVHQMEQNFAGEQLSLMWSPATKGPVSLPTIPLWRNGERVMVRLTDPEFGLDAFNALSGLGKEMGGWLVEFMATPARLLQMGVTTHPTFMPRNLFRDIFDAWIKTGALPISTQIAGARKMGDADFMRRYYEAGGIVGGRNIAALSSKEQQTKVLDLGTNRISRGSIVLGAIGGGLLGTLYGGPIGGVAGALAGGYALRRGEVLKAIEAVETMTRVGVASYAYKRALEHNPDLSETEAMLEAAFVARDVFDWNRRGSKMLGVVRCITFLNAQIQGLDAAVRKLGGDSDRGSMLAKHISMVWKRENGAQLSAEEERELGNAYKTWARMGAYTLGLVSLYAVATSGDDDDDKRYQDVRDKTKATHSWMPNVFGVDLRLPKAFEWAMPANVVEAIADKVRGRDPRAWDRVIDSTYEVMAPPLVPQALSLIVGLTTNAQLESLAPWVKRLLGHEPENSSTKQIVGDQLARLDPESQFDAFSSQLSIDIAKSMAAVGVDRDLIPSPKKIDFILRTGGYWGQDIAKGYGIVREGLGFRPREAPRVSDIPVVAGFTGVAARQSKSRDELFKLMAQSGGLLATAAATYKQLIDEEGTPADAERLLSRLNPEERAYTLLKYYGSPQQVKDHPLERLLSVDRVLSKIRKDMILDRLTPVHKEGRKTVREFDEKIALSPRKQTELHDIIERLQQSESWNTMVLMKRPGWEGKKEIATKPILDELKASSPKVFELFEDRLQAARAREFSDVKQDWPDLRARILRDGVNAF